MSKSFLPNFRRTLLMFARRGYPFNITNKPLPFNNNNPVLDKPVIYQTTQQDVNKFTEWVKLGDDEYTDKLELFNAYKRGVDIMGYIPYFFMTDQEFTNLYTQMKSDRSKWTYEYSIMKGDKGDINIEGSITYSFLLPISQTEFTFVYFADSKDESIGITIIKHCISTTCAMKSQGVNVVNIVLIINKSLTSAAKKDILDVDKGCPYRVQIFTENEIATDPFDCVYNSDIKIVTTTDVESKKWLKDNNLMVSQIPRRPIDDPELKYLGIKEGLIVELTRNCLIPENVFSKEKTFAYTYIQCLNYYKKLMPVAPAR